MARIEDTDEVIDTRTLTGATTIVGVFTGGTAREAVRKLERAGFVPDRIGIVAGNVRQGRIRDLRR